MFGRNCWTLFTLQYACCMLARCCAHLLFSRQQAKTLVDIARSQDDEVGDGTTSVCLLAGELLRSVKPLIEDGLHPQTIIRGFRLAQTQVQLRLRLLQPVARISLTVCTCRCWRSCADCRSKSTRRTSRERLRCCTLRRSL